MLVGCKKGNSISSVYKSLSTIVSLYSSIGGMFYMLDSLYSSIGGMFSTLNSLYSSIEGMFSMLDSLYSSIGGMFSKLGSLYSNIEGMFSRLDSLFSSKKILRLKQNIFQSILKFLIPIFKKRIVLKVINQLIIKWVNKQTKFD